MKTLLLGMGNPILSDDVVGLRLAADLGLRLAGCPDLTVHADYSVGGLEVLEVQKGYARAIVIDSIRVVEAVPGRWHAFDASALRETLHLTNVHDANFATVLELGHRLGMPLPRAHDVHVFAIEAQDVATFSEQMTPALAACYPALADAIFGEVRALLATGESHDSLLAGHALRETRAMPG